MQGPDFILIGQQRAGTRWLYDQLRSSDRFWMPPIKEISYFKGSIFKKAELHQLLEMTRGGDCADLSEADLACLRHLEHLPNNRAITSGDYLRIFSFKGDRISGDITPKYEKIPKKKIIDVWNLVPDAKLVYLIRNPVDRIESAIGMFINKGRLNPECLSNVEAMEKILMAGMFVLRMSPTSTWKNWSSIFSERNMGYWFFDDIRERPDTVRDQIASFLGAKGCAFALPAGYNRKEGDKKLRLEPNVRDYIRHRLDGEINAAKAFFGSRAAEWR
jgi:hypothetical protein